MVNQIEANAGVEPPERPLLVASGGPGTETMATLPSRLAGAVSFVTRAESRWPALFKARLERPDKPSLKVTLRNVSRSGFMALTSDPVQAGSHITISLPIGKPVKAEVRWAFNDRFGCHLDDPFDKRQLAFLFGAGALNGLISPAGIRFVVVLACVAMYLLA